MSTFLKPEDWVKEHSDYLYGYAITRIFHKDDALDLIQETYISAIKARESFNGESTERTWLTAILKRKIIDYYRKKTSNKENFIVLTAYKEDHFQDSGIFEGHWKAEKAPIEWAIDTNNLENEEFHGIFNNCLSFLPKTWAAVFTLKVIEEYSTEEICKELNITSSNIWTTMHRAKLQLRDCVEKKWFKDNKTL
jgi:RNA polymerase sigma-70 factor (ECF subfamily)